QEILVGLGGGIEAEGTLRLTHLIEHHRSILPGVPGLPAHCVLERVAHDLRPELLRVGKFPPAERGLRAAGRHPPTRYHSRPAPASPGAVPAPAACRAPLRPTLLSRQSPSTRRRSRAPPRPLDHARRAVPRASGGSSGRWLPASGPGSP